MKLPLKLALELSKTSDDDTTFYELVVEVPGNDKSMTVAVISFTSEGLASVSQVARDGLDGLDAALRDRLLIRLFKLAYGAMVEGDGSAIEWWLSDISRLVQRRFDPADAGVMAATLATFVNPTVAVEDMSVVRID